MVLVMWGLLKALRTEQRRTESGGVTSPTRLGGEQGRESWKERLARATNFVDAEDAERHLDRVVEPALREVSDELCQRGVETTATRGVAEPDEDDPDGGAFVELRTAGEVPFVYRVQVGSSPVPAYGGRMVGARDRYARLEVHLADGGQDYDVMGCTQAEVIHDCLDHYERHLEFLRIV
jgi:choline/glycine/proline betaine transport protein